MEIRKITLNEKVEFGTLLNYCFASGSNDDPVTESDVNWITLDEGAHPEFGGVDEKRGCRENRLCTQHK